MVAHMRAWGIVTLAVGLAGCDLVLGLDERDGRDWLDGYAYRKQIAITPGIGPRCITIKVGQAATWQGTFADHPLAPGIIRGSNVETQPGSPIPAVTNGVTRTVTFPAAGDWAYFCTDHSPEMAGVVFVVP